MLETSFVSSYELSFNFALVWSFLLIGVLKFILVSSRNYTFKMYNDYEIVYTYVMYKLLFACTSLSLCQLIVMLFSTGHTMSCDISHTQRTDWSRFL